MQDDTACAIGKSYGRDLQARIAAAKDGAIVVFQAIQDDEFRQFPPAGVARHLMNFFREGHFGKEFVGVLIDLLRG